MKTIRFFPDDRSLAADEGETILSAALREELPIAHACGGHARCSTCRILVEEGEDCCASRTAAEDLVAERLAFPDEIRLACQTVVRGDMQVRRLVLDDEDVELTSKLAADAAPERVGTERRLAILFADIRSFTAISEALLPYDVIHVLNRYFRLAEQAVVEHGGWVDNYMGDGLLALFDGESPEAAARSAVAAGLEMLRVVESDVASYVRDHFDRALDIRIGAHYGLVVSGIVGGRESRRETVIGDAVNVAARIEAANKLAGTRFLVSDQLRAHLGDTIVSGCTSTVSLRGKTGEHVVHEVLALSPRDGEPEVRP